MRLATIAEFCTTGTGGTPLRSLGHYYGGDIPWVKSGELRENLICKADEFLTEEAVRATRLKIVPSGAILVAMYGATVGRVARLGIPATTNQAVCHVIPDARTADANYLYHCLRSKLPEFLARRVGGAQPNISQGIIRQTKILLPPLDQQHRVAAVLDKADGLREKRRQAIDKLDTLLQSIFHDMFGDPMKNQRQWDIVTPQDVASSEKYSIAIGPFGSSLLTSDYRSSGVPLVFVKNIRERRFNLKNARYVTTEKARELGPHVVKGGDILITKMGDPPGDCAVYPLSAQPAIITADCIKLTLNKSVATPEYISAVFDTAFMRREIQRAARGVAQQKINLNLFKELTFPLPPIDEQRRFSHRVQAIESLRGTMEESTTRISNLFLSIQQRAFNGELFNGKALASLR